MKKNRTLIINKSKRIEGAILNITYRKLIEADLHENLLNDFNRYQEVEYDWKKVNGELKLVHNPHIEDWTHAKKVQKINDVFAKVVELNGYLLGAFENEKLIGFAACNPTKYGSRNQYIQLMELHVSLEYRGLGIGRSMFEKCVDYGTEMKAQKLYIVASSSMESQEAYKKLGCVYARELVRELYEQDPDDIHMEFC